MVAIVLIVGVVGLVGLYRLNRWGFGEQPSYWTPPEPLEK
jgi:hypothetical protein